MSRRRPLRKPSAKTGKISRREVGADEQRVHVADPCPALLEGQCRAQDSEAVEVGQSVEGLDARRVSVLALDGWLRSRSVIEHAFDS